MEKSKPHHDLEKVKDLIRAGRYEITYVAAAGGELLGFKSRKAIAEFLLTLTRDNFYKSMTSDRNHKEWQDVYHVAGKGKIIYTKFTVAGQVTVRIISFKEK